MRSGTARVSRKGSSSKSPTRGAGLARWPSLAARTHLSGDGATRTTRRRKKSDQFAGPRGVERVHYTVKWLCFLTQSCLLRSRSCSLTRRPLARCHARNDPASTVPNSARDTFESAHGSCTSCSLRFTPCAFAPSCTCAHGVNGASAVLAAMNSQTACSERVPDSRCFTVPFTM
jgi:hypothetical protein